MSASLEPVSASPGVRVARELWRRRSTRVALLVLAAAVLCAVFAPLLPLASPVHIDLERSLAAPDAPWHAPFVRGAATETWSLGPVDAALARVRSAVFGAWQLGAWCGTDAKGRDVLARIVWGSRVSFVVALCAGLTSLVCGVTWGALAGYLGGRADELMMRAVDALQSLPFVFVVIFVITLAGAWKTELESAGVSREVLLYVLVGAVSWLTMARVVRGQVLTLARTEFVLAARAQGASSFFVLRRHLVPNVLSIVIVYLTLSVPSILLTEAFLSFLGLGIEPPKVSWGLLAADSADAINPLRVPWWIVVFPAAAMGATLLALNLLGDALRDALDPRLAEGGARR